MAQGESHPDPVMLDVPPRILGDLQALVAAGIYLPVEEALRELIVVSLRHIRGSYLTVRVEPMSQDVDSGSEADAGA